MKTKSPSDPGDRRSEVLEASRELLRTRGFNAFSHRDLAARVGIKSSSVHYHFPTKEDIGLALQRENRDEMAALFQQLQPLAPAQRLERIAAVYVGTAKAGDHWCLAGMLASDYETLGEALRAELRALFDGVEGWLAAQTAELMPGRDKTELRDLARTAMAALEGALLLARVQQDPARMRKAAGVVLGLLGAR